MRFADLDAVTLDAYGTLVSLVDPVPKLARALAAHGVDRNESEIKDALAQEIAYYGAHTVEGRDRTSLRALRRDCAGIFLTALGADVDAGAFADEFVTTLEFALLRGVKEALAALRARGIALAVVSNWDCSLPEHLRAVGIVDAFATIVTSAAAGVQKPDPRPFRAALAELGVDASRSVHVGDRDADDEGARAAGMAFVPAPLATAFREWR